MTRKPDGKGYRIAVKREEGGQVSNWLHNHANVGDVVKLVAPAGDFFMAVADDTPVTLISAGVGQTPMLAMLDTLAKAGHTAQVNWFHAAENGDVHAFADEVKELGQSLPRFTAHTWYRQPSEADRAKGQFDSERSDGFEQTGRCVQRSDNAVLSLRPGWLHAVYRETVSGSGREAGKHSLRMLWPA